MKIAVFGSWSDHKKSGWELRGTQTEFETACFDLGRKIAQNRHSVLIGSQSPHTSDAHIVDGIVGEINNNHLNYPLVKVLRPKDRRDSYQDLAKDYPHIFDFYSRSESYWEAAHLFAIRESDAVLIIGGARGSYLAGLASIISGKRVVPVGSFGGAGEKLLDILDKMPDVEDKDDFRRLHGPWTDFTLELVLKLIGVYNHPKVLIIHGRDRDWLNLKDYLQNALNLPEPVVMGQKFGYGKTLPEKFEYLASQVEVAIAIATPDDVGGLADGHEQTRNYNPRARQNVWLEVGWFWGRLGRERIMIISRGDIEIPSDISGVEVYSYYKNLSEVYDKIRVFVEKSRG